MGQSRRPRCEGRCLRGVVGRPGLELHSCGLWAGSVSLWASVLSSVKGSHAHELERCLKAWAGAQVVGRLRGGAGVTGLGMGPEALLPEGPGQGRP